MNSKELKKFTEAFNIQEIETPQYQEALKKALLSRASQKQSLFSKIQTNINIIKSLMNNKKLFGVGSFAMIAVFALTVVSFNYNTPRASAQSLVEKSITIVSQTSASELAKMQEILGIDLLQSLNEAKNAKDLKEVTKAEFDTLFDTKNVVGIAGTAIRAAGSIPATGNPTEVGGTTGGALIPVGEVRAIVIPEGTKNVGEIKNNSVSLSGNISKFLTYTDVRGRLTGLGLDKNGLPLFKQVVLSKGDVQDLK